PYEYIDENSYNYWGDKAEDLKAGEEITLKIYDDGIRYQNVTKKAKTEKSFIIAGFSEKVENENLIEQYTSMFVHPSIAEELKPYGYKWSNHVNFGFVLFEMDYHDIQMAQKLEERFIING